MSLPIDFPIAYLLFLHPHIAVGIVKGPLSAEVILSLLLTSLERAFSKHVTHSENPFYFLTHLFAIYIVYCVSTFPSTWQYHRIPPTRISVSAQSSPLFKDDGAGAQSPNSPIHQPVVTTYGTANLATFFDWFERFLVKFFPENSKWVPWIMQVLPWGLMFSAMLIWAWIWGGKLDEHSVADYGPRPELHYHYYPAHNANVWKH